MLTKFADFVAYSLLGLDSATRLGLAVHFFVYDILKVTGLLTVVVFVVSFIRSFLPPEKTKKYLVGRSELVGNVLAALVGIVTPFCSCSAVPLFIGLVESGVPLGVTFSFLVSSPMVNEVAAILLWGLFGWRIALLYIGTGVIVAIVAGVIIGRLHLESQVEEYVYSVKAGQVALPEMTIRDRVEYAKGYTVDIVKRVWPYIAVGIAVGGFIHGYAPEDFLATLAGKHNLFAVPVAVAIGVPLYSNAAGIIPVVQALMAKGLPVGTTLAFMMAVTALSLPEMIILRRVIKPKLLAAFVGIMTVTIVFVGYLFNAVI